MHSGYTQIPPLHVPVETDAVLNSSSAWTVRDHGAITRENIPELRSGLIPERPLPSPCYPYPQLLPLNPSGDVWYPPSSYSWEGINQLPAYPNITIEGANPQLPAAHIIDSLPQISSQWMVGDLEPRFNQLRIASPHWEQNNQYRAHAGIALEQLIPPAQPLPEVHIPPRLSPRMLGNPQRQASHFLDHESPPPDSSANSARSSRSFFRNARHFQMGDLNYIDAPNATHVNKTHVTNNTVVTSGSINGWEILQKHVASNALHNSSARYDAPKCDEDTRVEVTDEIMGFIEDREHPQQLLCMTGAAGSGKSALQQTVAIRCAKGNILGAAYFIFAGDSSRNTASTIIPTIAYQLGLKHPLLQHSIASAVEHDPLVFSQSLETQMDVLIVRPFESLRRSEEYDISTFPYVILIDGLDECQDEPDTTTNLGRVEMKYRAEDRQAELLSTIKNSLLNHDLPFRIFIASRPELPIRTALGAGGSLHRLAYHIQLSDQYDATEDMRRYLRRRFQDIGLRINQPNWFTEGNIETLVQAGSGQFVYVATVFKYVSERRASPAHRLKTVLNWTADQGQLTKPFEALDILYTSILLNAKEAYEAVDTHSGRDFLLLLKMFYMRALRDLEEAYAIGGGGIVVTKKVGEFLEDDSGKHHTYYV
ncbi:hypothetical protein EST38_g10256 [Candolleomyces aberdarensis]|uniref:Nephrocystin 3-like N-terminal domain-containing protein n=1 Tax=Candolleomyces aberdarensis TaxID=2316362 RepID=A0A4Q2D8J0_9AGAR|nr:hypothetical protein EST38_g10256 [Candolleomyces aberdarensis]